MRVTVKFFASLRERIGITETVFESSQAQLAVQDIWQALSPVEPPASVLIAVNMEYVSADHLAGDGDEVAFFPPVTGG